MSGIGIAKKGLGLLGKKKKRWKKSEHMGWTKKEVEIEMGDRSLMNPSKKISKKKRPRTKAEMIERIRQLDPKVYGKDIATFGSGIEKKQMKKIFPKGKK
jgi:hypothetical protein